MSWIEYHDALRDFWKIERLAHILQVPYAHALGLLSCLWLWAVKNARDGKLKHFTDLEVAKAARWEGNAEGFKEHLRICKLIDRGTDRLHDWSEYGTRMLEESRRKQREYRLRKKEQSNEPSVT